MIQNVNTFPPSNLMNLPLLKYDKLIIAATETSFIFFMHKCIQNKSITLSSWFNGSLHKSQLDS